MTRRYLIASMIAGAAGLTALVWALAAPDSVHELVMVIGSVAAPMAVLTLVAARTEQHPRWGSLVGGGLIGVVVTMASAAIVFAAAAWVLAPVLESGRVVLERLRVDPRLATVATSPWLLVLAIQLVVVAPVTEEAGKAIGARLGGFTDRRQALLAGVAAGVGFAMIENVGYAVSSSFLGGGWVATSVARITGAAVHPLASALVMLGWWDWRMASARRRGVRLALAGVGVHALWNGSLVALTVVSTAFEIDATSGFILLSLVYSAGIGVGAIALLAVLTRSVADDHPSLAPSLDLTDTRLISASFVIAASLIIPVTVLTFAIPGFIR